MEEEEKKEGSIGQEEQPARSQSKKIKEEEWVGMLSVRNDKILINEEKAQDFVYIKRKANKVKYFFNEED